jgi:hypothetical protein
MTAMRTERDIPDGVGGKLVRIAHAGECAGRSESQRRGGRLAMRLTLESEKLGQNA